MDIVGHSLASSVHKFLRKTLNLSLLRMVRPALCELPHCCVWVCMWMGRLKSNCKYFALYTYTPITMYVTTSEHKKVCASCCAHYMENNHTSSAKEMHSYNKYFRGFWWTKVTFKVHCYLSHERNIYRMPQENLFTFGTYIRLDSRLNWFGS